MENITNMGCRINTDTGPIRQNRFNPENRANTRRQDQYVKPALYEKHYKYGKHSQYGKTGSIRKILPMQDTRSIRNNRIFWNSRINTEEHFQYKFKTSSDFNLIQNLIVLTILANLRINNMMMHNISCSSLHKPRNIVFFFTQLVYKVVIERVFLYLVPYNVFS